MDCRRTLVLALALLVANLGCLNHTVLPGTPSSETTAVHVQKERDLPKRQPQAATCVAFGTFTERMAGDPSHAPVERDRLRDQARRAYQQALEIDAENLPALMALARYYTTIEDHERALATYRKATQAHPKEASVWFELGMCHARQKDWESALQNLRKAVDLDPENRQVVNTLGFCLARAGRYEESLATFKTTGNEAEAHVHLARMLHHMNQNAMCREHVQLALRLDPELGSAQQLLAELDNSATPASAQTAQEGPATSANALQPASAVGATPSSPPAGGSEP